MRFEQSQKQQAVLAPVMRHSLQCLQMSAYDLFLHVQDEAMENPMLDVDMSSIDLLSDTAAGDKDAVTLAVEDAVPFAAALTPCRSPLPRRTTVMAKVCRSICTNSWGNQNGWILRHAAWVAI